MSRRNPNEQSELAGYIDSYKQAKDQENTIKKANTELGNKIKSLFNKLGISTFDTDSYTAKVTIIQNESLDDDRVIRILREQAPEVGLQVIKTKEYIDEDALEKAIFVGALDASILEPAKVVKDPTIKLNVTKKKKEDK